MLKRSSLHPFWEETECTILLHLLHKGLGLGLGLGLGISTIT